MATNPERNGAFVILENKEGKVLLVHHNYGGKKWSLPGGGIGLAESARRAAPRELYEESGYITVEGMLELVAVLSSQYSYGLHLLFCCTKKAEELGWEKDNLNQEEIDKMRFASIEEVSRISEAELYPAQRRMILEHYQNYKKDGVVFTQL
jgi:8-oxo-dGTP pyrophosphatase MutT (NUDIX family)